LKALQQAVETELAQEGFPRELKRFSPHLTLGRLRSPKNGATLAEALLRSDLEATRFHVREIIVMKSNLSPKGSTYTPQAVIPLSAS
jgi:2'-5' RNA ligase